MEAKMFEFIPGEIRVNQGETVRLKITATDVKHGFAISEYGINEQLLVGQEATIEFVADKKGTFTFFCSVMCGSGHRDMKGTLIVE
jgi:cytochrome c oxidase subunit 2